MYELPDESPYYDIESHDSHREVSKQIVPLCLVRLDRFEAPFVLAESERDAYVRRFTTLLLDESSVRYGGLGCVMRAKSACGEVLAVKRLLPQTESSQETSHVLSDEQRQAAFRREYELHRTVHSLKGFPRLYGWGYIEGAPAIVMEWIEGESLAHVRHRFAVDDAGRMSPLTVARIGRDMFDVLARLDFVEGGLAHRDVSPSNIVVRTSCLDVSDQIDEGVFDLCLLDFGSAAAGDEAGAVASSNTTVAYAAPELLDGSKSAKMRRSSAVDVYAAASVLYELLYACLPFERFEDELSIGEAKRTKRPAFGASAHRVAEDVSVVLAREPEIAVAVGMESSQMSVRPHAEDVRTALSSIDAQFEAVIEACLSVDPKDRPCPAAARDACGAFAFRYAGNIRHALRGEPLDSCVSGGPASGFAGSPLRIRNLLRSVGKAASAAVWSVSVVATGLLVHGVDASWALGPCSWSGSLNGCAVSAALAVPALAGFAIRGKRSHTLRGFLSGSVALLSMACLVFLLGLMLELPSDEVFRGLAAALFAVVAAGWCPLVLDYALAVLPFRPRKALPASRGEASVHALDEASGDDDALSLQGGVLADNKAATGLLPEKSDCGKEVRDGDE